MDASAIFKGLFFACLIALFSIRLFFGWKVRRAGQNSWSVEKEAVQREGAGGILLRGAAFLAILGLAGLYAALPGEPAWLVLPIPDGIRWLGVGFCLLGLGLLIWVHWTLREFWSTVLQLRERHLLVTSGPYRRVRHPMYAVLMLCFFGLALISAVWPLLALAIAMVPFFHRVTVKEEEMMMARFGEAYREYRARTGRFTPRLCGHVGS